METIKLFMYFCSLIKRKNIDMRIRHQSENPEQLVATIVEAMDSLKGKEIVTLDLRETGTAVIL